MNNDSKDDESSEFEFSERDKKEVEDLYEIFAGMCFTLRTRPKPLSMLNRDVEEMKRLIGVIDLDPGNNHLTHITALFSYCRGLSVTLFNAPKTMEELHGELVALLQRITTLLNSIERPKEVQAVIYKPCREIERDELKLMYRQAHEMENYYDPSPAPVDVIYKSDLELFEELKGLRNRLETVLSLRDRKILVQ